MTTDLLALLDRLEAVHAAATGRESYPSAPTLVQNETEVEAVWSDGGRSVLAECYGENVAAAIVAEHNAIPGLVAAVRAALALADELEANGRQREALGKPAWPLNVARDLRTALASSLPDTTKD